MFPLELLPKISDPANPYKAYVDEFTSLRDVVLDRMRGVPGAHPPRSNPIFLLLLLPVELRLAGCLEKMAAVAREEATSRGGLGATCWGGGLVMACIIARGRRLGVPLPELRAGWSESAGPRPR